MLDKKYIAQLVGDEIKNYRLKYGLSIKKIGKNLGRTPIEMSEMEKGKIEPRLINALTKKLEIHIRNFIIICVGESIEAIQDHLKK